MGDNFLQQQADNGRRRRDRVAAGDGSPRLFVRPELVTTSYTIHPVNGHEFSVGDIVIGVASRKGRHVEVTDGQRKLGHSEGDSGHSLRDELSKPGGQTAVQMRVCEVGGLSGVAQARIVANGEAK